MKQQKSKTPECAELDILKGVVLQNMHLMLTQPNLFDGVYEEIKLMNTHRKLFQLTNDAYEINKGTTLYDIFSDLAQLAGNKEKALEMLEPFFTEQVKFFIKVIFI